ncbi:RHS repeat-associated core domain-containing protein, partial [Staphylococcus aureus]|nr:RHS repeat-associated core domain-containing protein [Staphylococcus aureus]
VTGLYYYGFRYYIPWMARWVNPDPAGYSDGLNVYEMTRNNPATYFDPDGHHSFSYSVPDSGVPWMFMLLPALLVL